MRKPDAASEARLDAIRRNATEATVEGQGGSYYGLPLLKPTTWTWEVPAYFFVGGAAGAAAVIGFAGQISGADAKLVRDARWIAAIGAALSAPLLIADLGRPERFLHMLRVFKPKSPMSVGAWTLTVFGATSAAAAVLSGGQAIQPVRTRRLACPPPGDVAAAASALTGLVMTTYTGVLLGVTVIPVWTKHAHVLPIHFAASSLGAAAALLEICGNRQLAVRRLALTAALVETVMEAAIEQPNMTARIAGAFAGPIPLAIRLLLGKSRKARQAAAVSALLGSILTRVAWVEAGS